ncbi:MAG: hypothetical protein Q8S84_06270 [bacterium]|nr:hypothetical protein [bacterium]
MIIKFAGFQSIFSLYEPFFISFFNIGSDSLALYVTFSLLA